MLFHITYLLLTEFCDPCDCSQIFFSFLSLLMQKIFVDKNHWLQLLSTKIVWIISLFLISITYLGHSTMSSFCSQKNNLWLSMKTLLLLLTKSPNAENSVFRLTLSFFRSFCFLFCFFLPIETTTANLQGLTYSNSCKMY